MESLYITTNTLLKKTAQQSSDLLPCDYQSLKGGDVLEASVIMVSGNHFFLQNIKNSSFLNGFVFRDHATLNSPTQSCSQPTNVPDAALDLIKQFEGFSATAYVDPLSGNLPITIGYGTTRKADGSPWYLGNTITKDEATELLRKQVDEDYVSRLSNSIPCWKDLNDNQKSAIISFAYNLGADFYNADGFNSISRAIDNFTEEKSDIETAFLRYVNPGSNVEEGLRRRRLAEANLFNS